MHAPAILVSLTGLVGLTVALMLRRLSQRNGFATLITRRIPTFRRSVVLKACTSARARTDMVHAPGLKMMGT